jgi:hypothetical protein
MKKISAIYIILVLLMASGCTQLPATPKIKIVDAWDQSYHDVVKHIIDCEECGKNFKGFSELSSLEDSVYSGKFSKCPEYLEIYKRSTTFGDWQLYPMGWQWKGPTQEKYIWDYEKQKWLRK